ncbi:MAG: hypothetical protein ACERLM_01235, partial [Acidimicrobiales bacterium]
GQLQVFAEDYLPDRGIYETIGGREGVDVEALVAEVAAEWARRHGRPHRLVLTGPAGGTFSSGDPDAETIELDAVEFCRILSGRAEGPGLLATTVPF